LPSPFTSPWINVRLWAVPGIPQGATGMEQADGKTQAYDVLLIKKDGTAQVFASH
jgi:hypothetical protein